MAGSQCSGKPGAGETAIKVTMREALSRLSKNRFISLVSCMTKAFLSLLSRLEHFG
jgi:hypothetical protein